MWAYDHKEGLVYLMEGSWAHDQYYRYLRFDHIGHEPTIPRLQSHSNDLVNSFIDQILWILPKPARSPVYNPTKTTTIPIPRSPTHDTSSTIPVLEEIVLRRSRSWDKKPTISVPWYQFTIPVIDKDRAGDDHDLEMRNRRFLTHDLCSTIQVHDPSSI